MVRNHTIPLNNQPVSKHHCKSFSITLPLFIWLIFTVLQKKLDTQLGVWTISMWLFLTSFGGQNSYWEDFQVCHVNACINEYDMAYFHKYDLLDVKPLQ